MYFISKENMTALTIHGFVQIWNTETGMSKSKEAFIETRERKKKVRLVVHFSTGEYTTFQLGNNIKNVVFRSYGENKNYLHLTFQNNSFLFIKRLTSRDAKDLKMFLDRVHQNNLEPPMRPDKDESVIASTKTQKKIDKTLFNKIYKKSRSGFFETGKGNRAPDLQKMPLYTSESSMPTCKDLFKKGWGKRKRMISGSERYEKLQEENKSVRNKKSKINLLKYIIHDERKKKWLKELKESKKLDYGPLFKTNSTGNPYLDGTCFLQSLSEKIYFTLLLESLYSEDDPEWDRLKMTFDFYPEKLCQGLPNLGNTCYMNAVLQSLFSIPSFAYDLLYQGFPWSKIPLDALSMCLSHLLVLKDIYSIKIKEKLLVNIKNAISTVAEIFSDNTQNDAHEFLGHCLDQMKENTEKLNKIWKTKIESEEENSPQQFFADSAVTKMLVCPVITNFEVELLHSIICKACGQVVLKTEVSNYLSINLPQGTKTHPLSIQSTFDLFFGAEELEYKCGKCKHKTSVSMHKISRLPRVLIVHLKRYSFNKFWTLRKDGQEVIVSKYLNLSSHCNESTKPPLPLNKNVHIRDFQFLKFFRKINFEILRSLTPSTKLTSEFKDCLAPHIGSDKEFKPQKYKIFGSSKEQQKKKMGKHSKLTKTEPILVHSGYGTAIGQELLVPSSVRYLKDTNLSSVREDEGKPTSGSDACPAKVHFQEVPRNPKLKKSEKTSMFAAVDSVAKTTEDFYEAKKNRISEEFSNVAGQTQHCEKVRIYEQALWQALLQSLQKTDAQWCTNNLRRPTELNLQEANANSLGASGSNKNLGDKDFLGKEKTEAKAKKPKRNPKMRDRYDYRLIGVISHLGKTLDSGHYISDAYDFERQVWFTYNDMQVLSIEEALMQEARLCTGYIFFYMHNKIFEELLGREENSQPHSTKAGKNHQRK
ncbi:PREDICTED: ubiquitin carboxyl-terminal hydrolase 26 [Miniopterus natalensis]|uniref:ubiquitin carboxyl-terminal hydrolase 26 n=1 Tax=Miniopterus natalensis TaxID=291302 RepID=UPI0007A720B9|nr:PREDICTED: ubiquitin carboxyl-terminal hydrolase 26 [Miniopterus natalensis]XP_016053511.1 PREDICTED: ubiquitin carboxyl-terminal hydrolase 26 [Miniopterus natalensis]